ncbi:MAG: signal peptidase II [Puniceicoccales bacterium]|jgi:signal peptidase II|nr:signal peptidase II [Puniceicoccales bacterium]
MEKRFSSWFLFIVVFISTLLFDGITKYFIRSNALALALEPISLIDDWLYITYAKNTGAAWSLFRGHNLELAILGIIATAILFWNYSKTLKIHPICYSLLIGGILGNVIDRIQYGYVTDFIDIHLPFYRWPSFNIADSAICISACLLIASQSSQSQTT